MWELLTKNEFSSPNSCYVNYIDSVDSDTGKDLMCCASGIKQDQEAKKLSKVVLLPA